MNDFVDETANLLPNETPAQALERIRHELKRVSDEYEAGQLSSVQFYALYRHYTEKQTIIQTLIERNPDSDAWRAAASAGQTNALRERFEARPLYYVVFSRDSDKPLITDGKIPRSAAQQLHELLQKLWALNNWRTGIARKSLGDGLWLLLTIGEHSLTMTVFFMQPSEQQTQQVRNLHADFERANVTSLRKGEAADRMVFPQRALLLSTE